MNDAKLENIGCDLCGSTNYQIIFNNVIDNELKVSGKFNIGRCVDCGLIYLNPKPKSEHIGKYYPNCYVPYQKEGKLISAIKKILWLKDIRNIKKLIKPGDSILEIGCSNGDFLHMFRGSNYKLYGLELNRNCIKNADDFYNLKIWQGRFEEFTFNPKIKFDFVIMNYVLEHLLSPKAAFLKLCDIITSRGYLLISIPNFNSWERMVFGRYWHSLDAPRHLYIFDESTIKKYAHDAGFEIVSTNYSFVPNDWIGSIGRYFREKGIFFLADFFSVKNRIISGLFLPLSISQYVFGKSSRFSLILRKI